MPFRHSAELRPNESPRALLGNPKYHRHSSGRGGERAWIIKESTSFLFKNVGPRLSAANRTITGGSVTKPRTAHKRIPNLGNTRGRALPFCSPPRHATPPVVCPLVALESKHCSYLAALPCVAFASKRTASGASLDSSLTWDGHRAGLALLAWAGPPSPSPGNKPPRSWVGQGGR